ncbi:hypothetical protein PC121_g4180 [Phytophthora cactorum]|nr:hypothetical protein PC121_g4180 [Phytophthora cactorum]
MEQRREQLRTRSQQWHTQRGMELGELQQNKEDITVFGSYSRSSGNTGTGSVGVTCFGTKYLRACHQSYRKTTKLSERVDLALDSHTMSSNMTNCRSARCYDNEEGDVCYCRYKINTCEAGRTTVVYQQDHRHGFARSRCRSPTDVLPLREYRQDRLLSPGAYERHVMMDGGCSVVIVSPPVQHKERRPRRQEQVRSRDDREASEADRHSDGHTATNSPAPSSVCSPTAEDVSHHNGATEIYDFDDGVASATPLKLQLGDRTQHMSDQHFSDTVTEARLPPSSRSSTLRQPVVESRKHQTPQ